MPGSSAVKKKLQLWRGGTLGLKSRVLDGAKEPVMYRVEIPQLQIKDTLSRADEPQKIRMRRYPSSDVMTRYVRAGVFPGKVGEVVPKLREIGFSRSFVPYTMYSPDLGVEDMTFTLRNGRSMGNSPFFLDRPGIIDRVNDNLQVSLFKSDEGTTLLSLREVFAPLQPARTNMVGPTEAKRGVRDLRSLWEDTHDSQLPGRDSVKWDTSA